MVDKVAENMFTNNCHELSRPVAVAVLPIARASEAKYEKIVFLERHKIFALCRIFVKFRDLKTIF